jgi:hypothetical protein
VPRFGISFWDKGELGFVTERLFEIFIVRVEEGEARM